MQQPASWVQGFPLLVMVFFGVFFAIGNFLLARRPDGNRVLRAVLSLILFVDYLFFGYRVVLAVLDRLDARGRQSDARPAWGRG